MLKPVIMSFSVGGLVLALAVAGCAGSNDETQSSGQPRTTSSSKPADLWRAPPDPLTRTVAAGLKPEVKEQLAYHVHAHLDVFVDGKPVTVPAGIGINIDDPEVRR